MARDVWAIAEWLRDPANAESCATYPLDGARAAGPGLFAFHADDVARATFASVLGNGTAPIYVDQAGASARRSRLASGATLHSAVARTHLRGSTTGSSFRRSIGAMVWHQLDLHCDAPKRLAADSNARLTAWMLDHLRVATVAVDDRDSLWLVSEYVGHRLDPPLNLDGYEHTPARARVRELRIRHFSWAGADDGRGARFRELQNFLGAGL